MANSVACAVTGEFRRHLTLGCMQAPDSAKRLSHNALLAGASRAGCVGGRVGGVQAGFYLAVAHKLKGAIAHSSMPWSATLVVMRCICMPGHSTILTRGLSGCAPAHFTVTS